MSIKMQVIEEAIRRIEKELKGIDIILNATPLIDIIHLRQEVSVWIKGKDMLSREVAEYIGNAAKKEKAMFAMAEKQQETPELIERKVNLTFEFAALKNELFKEKAGGRR